MLQSGVSLGELVIDVDRNTARRYAAASGDANPIHVDDAAAAKLGLPAAIAHGMWTMGAALGLLDQAGIRADQVVSTFCRFGKPLVLPSEGETVPLLVTGAVTKLADDVATLALEVHAGTERIAKIEVQVRA